MTERILGIYINAKGEFGSIYISVFLSSNLHFTVQYVTMLPLTSNKPVQGSFSSPACLGDDANAKVFLELFQEDKGEHCVRDQADARRNKTLSMEIFGIKC